MSWPVLLNPGWIIPARAGENQPRHPEDHICKPDIPAHTRKNKAPARKYARYFGSRTAGDCTGTTV